MKRLLISLVLISSPLLAGAQVGVSVNIGEPGFYGQIDIGNMPRPPVVYSAPVIVEAPQGDMNYPPLYLRVPPEHHKNWRKYCHQYNACNRQVYFVTDDWYHNSYAPRYAKEHPHPHDEHGYDEHGHDGHGHDEHGHDEHGHDEHGHDEHGHEHGHEDER